MPRTEPTLSKFLFNGKNQFLASFQNLSRELIMKSIRGLRPYELGEQIIKANATTGAGLQVSLLTGKGDSYKGFSERSKQTTSSIEAKVCDISFPHPSPRIRFQKQLLV